MRRINKDIWVEKIFPQLSVPDFYRFRGVCKDARFVCDYHQTHSLGTIKQKKYRKQKVKTSLLSRNVKWIMYYTHDLEYCKHKLPEVLMEFMKYEDIPKYIMEYFMRYDSNGRDSMSIAFINAPQCSYKSASMILRHILSLGFDITIQTMFEKIYHIKCEARQRAINDMNYHNRQKYISANIKKGNIAVIDQYIHDLSDENIILLLSHDYIGQFCRAVFNKSESDLWNLFDKIGLSYFPQDRLFMPIIKEIRNRNANFLNDNIKVKYQRIVDRIIPGNPDPYRCVLVSKHVMESLHYFASAIDDYNLWKRIGYYMDNTDYLDHIENRFPNVDHQYEKNYKMAVEFHNHKFINYYARKLQEHKMDLPHIETPPPDKEQYVRCLESQINKRRKIALETE